MSSDEIAALKAELAEMRETLAQAGLGRRRLFATALAGLGGTVVGVASAPANAEADSPTDGRFTSIDVGADVEGIDGLASFSFGDTGGFIQGEAEGHQAGKDPAIALEIDSPVVGGVGLVIGAAGRALSAASTGGPTILASQTGTGSDQAAIASSNAGTGPVIYAKNTGAHNANYAIIGTNVGASGAGARFTGARAAINLAPGSRASHPPSGLVGDLYVDANHRLWFCKGGPTWKQVA